MRRMFDLFVVMNDEELKEAIIFAKEQGAIDAKVIENITYELKFNGLDVADYCIKTGSWFPPFTEYVILPVSNEDCIAILLSPTVCNEYDINNLYKYLSENEITYCIQKDRFHEPERFDAFKEEERQASIKEPINSPWTARDIEVLETAINTIEGINSATLITQANVEINLFCLLSTGMPVAFKAPVTSFNYPNVLHLTTDNGYYNVFLGSDINLEEVNKLTQEKSINMDVVQFSEEESHLILYQPRERTSEKGKL